MGAKKSDSLLARIKRQIVIAESGCWIWHGATSHGYGKIRFRGALLGAHRASWMAHFGDIPEGMNVLHRCDTPPCINPAHLFLGTVLDNTADMIAKNRQRFGLGGKPFETEEAVRLRTINDPRPPGIVAAEIGVDRTTVRRWRILAASCG